MTRAGALENSFLFDVVTPLNFIYFHTIIDMQRNKAVLYTLCDTRANEIHVARGDARVYV